MNMTSIICEYCGTCIEKPTSEVMRAKKLNRPMYCSLSCGAKHSAKKRGEKTRNVLAYNVKPKLCKGCGNVIPYDKRINDYCTQSCAAKINNVRFPKRPARTVQVMIGNEMVRRYEPLPSCKQCGNAVKTRNCKFCSSKCERDFKRDAKFKLVIDGSGNARMCKKYLIHVHGNRCMECGWDKVNPKSGKCPIELEHIDGNHSNNELTNLRLLCPNCHSLTPTYKALNRGNGRYERMKRYNSGQSF